MSNFETAYAPLKQYEGGWCNVAGDAGGETYAGISRRYFPSWEGWTLIDGAKGLPSFVQGARSFSTFLDSLPQLEKAVQAFYRQEWWDALHLEQLPQDVADEIFEQSVNLGRAGSGQMVQRTCNAMNYAASSKLFADLKEDGRLGTKSLDALKKLLSSEGKAPFFVHCLNCLQGAHYINIAAKAVNNRQFLVGWMQRTGLG